jgi:hypothetical protein
MFFTFSQNPGQDNTLVLPLVPSRPQLPETAKGPCKEQWPPPPQSGIICSFQMFFGVLHDCDGKEISMLKMALVMTVLVSSSVAYALSNGDLIRLNQEVSRQQQEQQTDVVQFLEPMEQSRLREEVYWEEQAGRQQQEQLNQKHYVQELLLEWQRRQDAQGFAERGLRDMLTERQQSGLFQ